MKTECIRHCRTCERTTPHTCELLGTTTIPLRDGTEITARVATFWRCAACLKEAA